MSRKSSQVQSVAKEITIDSFVIKPPQRARLGFEIKGRAPLIQNNFPPKAMEEMLRKHMGLTVQREKKNPREVIENATIRNIHNDVCVKPVSIKLAMITAAGGLKTFQRQKTLLKTSLFVVGQSLPLQFKQMVPRWDPVSLGDMKRTRDIRFRPEFDEWSVRLLVQYSDTLLQPQSVADLLQRAGDVGICEWRPDKNGTNGTFDLVRAINDPEEIAEVEAASQIPLKKPKIPEWALDMNIDMTLVAKLFATEAEGEEGESEVEPELEEVAK